MIKLLVWIFLSSLPLVSYADLCALYTKQMKDFTRYTVFMVSEEGQKICLHRCQYALVYESYASLACHHKIIPTNLATQIPAENEKSCKEMIRKVVEIGKRIPSAGSAKLNCYYKEVSPPQAP